MKKLFLSLVALVSATMSFAQSSLIATLSHDGEISTFYGNSALREAHEAAQHGDIITLSSGAFPSVTITKAITLRGAGMQVDTVAKTQPTIITGDFNIQIPDSVEQRLTMEGLYCREVIQVLNLKNASFLKDRFKEIRSFGDNQIMQNVTFIHCKISSFFNRHHNLNSSNSASFVNCYIAFDGGHYVLNTEFTNCFIYCPYPNNVSLSTLNNSIIYCPTGLQYNNYYRLDKTCAAYYCLFKGNKNFFFDDIVNNSSDSYLSGDLNTLFKTYTGNYTDEETFELTDEAKKKYLGSDGSEIGIHGGFLPFDPTPTNPQITKCNVASKSTADGKLSVDIEVSAAE